MRAPLTALLLVGCGPAPVESGDELPPYVVLSGPIGADVDVSGVDTRGRIAWAWLAEGMLHGAVLEAPFEARVFAYALTVERPPLPGEREITVDPPTWLGDAGPVELLWGLPLLVEPTRPGDEPVVSVDPELLAAWFAGRAASPADALAATDGRVAAWTSEHALLAFAEDSGAARLGTAPDWDPTPALCAFDGLVEGLTLYRDEGGACGVWRALAPAGTRTEFQGVPMEAP